MTRGDSRNSWAADELRLRRLLDDTVSTIEPDDRLDQIRNRTKVTQMSTRRSWVFGAGGAALATAAVITAVAMIGNPLEQAGPNPPLGTPSVTATGATDPATPEPSETTTPPVAGEAIPVYYVGDTPRGPRLYREFQQNVDGIDPVMAAVAAAVGGDPLDPDYTTLWPQDADVTSMGVTRDLITIDLSGNLHDRPAGMTQAEASLSLNQLIYTAQAAYGEGRVPVQFLLDGGHTDQLLGEPASEALAEGDPMSTLALVNLTDPAEGTPVAAGSTLHVTGVACTFEANVPWTLLRGDAEVEQGFFMAAQGCDGVRLYPFAGDIELGPLSPGTYTLRIQEDDPSGGAEGFGPTSDTRTIVVE